jgi:RNA-splicing ligase RtcB
MDMIYPDMLKALEGTPIKADNASQQMGTLGGGNHFIEVCLDETDTVWLMLHSGSRGIGNKIGTYFIAKAKEDMRRWCINLPDADLADISGDDQLSAKCIEMYFGKENDRCICFCKRRC